MIIFSNTWHLLKIMGVLLKNGLDEVLLIAPLPKKSYLLRFIRLLLPSFWFPRKIPLGIRIRICLEELGPLFVKFGQLLSTRTDILPEDLIKELSKLQDQVPPFDSQYAISKIEKTHQKKIETLFLDFNPIPLASASIAQVHAAHLHSGESVVVKIQRPGIQAQIQKDLGFLYGLAHLAKKYSSFFKKFRPDWIVEEFEKILRNELDFLTEAANASQLKRNITQHHMTSYLYIPQVFWEYTTREILVLERIHGIPILEKDSLEKAGFCLKALAETGILIFFKQVFEDSFFHADMHPGNIFIDPTSIPHPRYLMVDFGMVGSLSPTDQRYLAENLMALFKRNYRQVALLHIESGWVPSTTRVDEFESAIRTVCEPIFGRPLKEISFGKTLMQLLQTVHRFHMPIQPQLILLQKTLITIEGLGRQLYPDLDLWKIIRPLLESWLDTQIGVKSLLKRLPEFPKKVEQLFNQVDLLAHSTATLSQLKSTAPSPEKGSFLKRLISPAVFFMLGLMMAYWLPHLKPALFKPGFLYEPYRFSFFRI